MRYWLGRISIQYADSNVLSPFGSPCLDGLQLASLLWRAQIAVFFTDELTRDTIQDVIEFDDASVDSMHASLGVNQQYTKHQLYVELWSPDLPAFEMTLVDLPGKFFCCLYWCCYDAHLGIISNAEQPVVDLVIDITVAEICKPCIVLVAVRMCHKRAAQMTIWCSLNIFCRNWAWSIITWSS